jgi:nitrate/TMAO reductase-like tetraheme cytochrome c subunit
MSKVRVWMRFVSGLKRDVIIRWLTRGSIAAFVIFVVGSAVTVHVTSQPYFCRSCHNMEPYYQSWKASEHKHVPCTDCHMAPGVQGTIHAKLQGISQVAKYFTGTAGTRPWAEVEDASCLRSGCHEARLLEGMGKDTFIKGVHFDHRPHLLESRRGKKLRCTSCHSQVVMGDHVKVTASTCILCHFKGRPPGEPVGGCKGCHAIPTDTITLPGGRVYIHSEVVDRGVQCVSCHATLTAGDGFVPRSRCYVCHNFPVEGFLDQDSFLHQKHVTEHKVECTDCHEEITHGYETRRRVARADCATCHIGVHNAEIELAEGTAASVLGETEARVGPMLAARVECAGCHIKPVSIDANDTYGGHTMHGDNQACINCHGPLSRSLLPSWKAFFTRRIAEVERAVASSRASADIRSRAKDLLLRVKHGRGVHNPTLARDLLAEAERLARGGRSALPPAPPATAVSDSGLDCRYCHLKAPEAPTRFDGATFLHGPHTDKLVIPCQRCHEPAPATFPQSRHGRVRLTKENCVSCHHWQKENCGACHGTGPAAGVNFRGVAFPHTRHTSAGVDCKTCHMKSIRGERRLSAIAPENCASCHHKPDNRASCLACHGKLVDAPRPPTVPFRGVTLPHKRHVDEIGLECKDCHKPARGMRVEPICQTCHHQEEMRPNCSGCHGDGPAAPVNTAWKPFPHPKHMPLGLSCNDCHKAGAPETVELICATCHEEAAAALAPPPASAPPQAAPPPTTAAPEAAPAATEGTSP